LRHSVLRHSFVIRTSRFVIPSMGRIITLHSFRGGTGKSNITANLAYLLAKRGRSVGVLDTDIQSPGIHLIFGLEQDRITYTLSDAVLGKCDIEEAVYDLADELQLAPDEGRVCLLPSSMAIDDISRVPADEQGAAHDGWAERARENRAGLPLRRDRHAAAG